MISDIEKAELVVCTLVYSKDHDHLSMPEARRLINRFIEQELGAHVLREFLDENGFERE